MVDFNVRTWLQKALWLSQCKASERISMSCFAHVVFQVFVRIAVVPVDGFRAVMFVGRRISRSLDGASFSQSWRAAFGAILLCADDVFFVSSSILACWPDMAGALSGLRQSSTISGSRWVAGLEQHLPTVS